MNLSEARQGERRAFKYFAPFKTFWKRKVARKKRRTDTLLMMATVVLQTKIYEDFKVTEKAQTSTFYWLKGATSAFTSKTLLRHYAKLNRPSL